MRTSDVKRGPGVATGELDPPVGEHALSTPAASRRRAAVVRHRYCAPRSPQPPDFMAPPHMDWRSRFARATIDSGATHHFARLIRLLTSMMEQRASSRIVLTDESRPSGPRGLGTRVGNEHRLVRG